MQKNSVNMVTRKLTATFLASALTSIMMAAFYIFEISNVEAGYNLGNEWMSLSLTYIIYVGAIIMSYGNIVSVVLEMAQKKWFKRHTWLYIVLHGIFGLPLGFIFQNRLLALFGLLAALIYAGIEWIAVKTSKVQGGIIMIIITILLYGLSWTYLQSNLPPLPPFTKEDAVQLATAGKGTAIDVFPDKIGKWQSVIDGYEVVRETSAEEIANETYIVTFTESWRKGKEAGSKFNSYLLERDGLTFHKKGGAAPPYLE